MVRKVIIVSVHVLYVILRLFTSDRRSCKVLKFTSVTSVYIGLRWWTGTWSSTKNFYLFPIKLTYSFKFSCLPNLVPPRAGQWLVRVQWLLLLLQPGHHQLRGRGYDPVSGDQHHGQVGQHPRLVGEQHPRQDAGTRCILHWSQEVYRGCVGVDRWVTKQLYKLG